MTHKILIFGGSGDLAMSKLVPALHSVYLKENNFLELSKVGSNSTIDEKITNDLLIICYGRKDLTENYHDLLKYKYKNYNDEFLKK